MRLASLLTLPLAALAAFGSGCTQLRIEPSGGTSGDPAAVEVLDLDGIDAELAALRGKPVVLNFWATWCAPCLAEMPALHELAKLAPHDLQVRTVSCDLALVVSEDVDTAEEIAAFAGKRDITLPIWAFDGSPEPLFEHFELDGSIPETLLFDASGKLVGRHLGAMSLEAFRAFVDEGLAPTAG